MANSKNWKAEVIPSLDGKNFSIKVTGDVQSDLVRPSLVRFEGNGDGLQNILFLQASGIVDGPTTEQLSYEEQIRSKYQYDIVLIYNEIGALLKAVKVNQVESFLVA